jgi:hypothetical protein
VLSSAQQDAIGIAKTARLDVAALPPGALGAQAQDDNARCRLSRLSEVEDALDMPVLEADVQDAVESPDASRCSTGRQRPRGSAGADPTGPRPEAPEAGERFPPASRDRARAEPAGDDGTACSATTGAGA